MAKKDLSAKVLELDHAREVAGGGHETATAIDALKKQVADSASSVAAVEKVNRQVLESLGLAERRAVETERQNRELREEIERLRLSPGGADAAATPVKIIETDQAPGEGSTGPDTEAAGMPRGVVLALLLAGVSAAYFAWKRVSKPKMRLVYEPAGGNGEVTKGVVGRDGRSDLNASESALVALRIEYIPSSQGRAEGFRLKAPQGSKLRYGLDAEDAKEIPAAGTVPFQFGSRILIYVGQAEQPTGYLEVKRNS